MTVLVVVMRMLVVVVMMAVRMIMVMCMAVFVLVVMREVDIKLYAGDGGFLPVRNVQMIAVELELLQLTFEIKNFHGEFISATDAHRLTQMVKIAAAHRICVSSVSICG